METPIIKISLSVFHLNCRRRRLVKSTEKRNLGRGSFFPFLYMTSAVLNKTI